MTGQSLPQMVNTPERWPTPQARDFRTGKGSRWQTPEKRSRNLNDKVAFLNGHKLLPTPTAQDAKNSTLPPSQRERDSIPGFLLRNGEQSGGRLNPDWVEWLMGVPIGWTDVEVSVTGRSRTAPIILPD